MKVQKTFFILISALSFTFLILTIQKIEFPTINAIRNLGIDESKVDEICKSGPEKVSSYYYNTEFKLEPEDPSRYQSKQLEVLLELIDGKTDNVMSYLMTIIPFAVFIVLGILSIFGWLFCCCCCCCPCCCCNQTNKNQYLCRSVAFIVSMALFSLIVGLSLYGFFKLSDIMKGLSGMSCAVFKLYLEILNGQSVEKLPKWTGVNGIVNTLNDIQATVNQLVKDKDNIFTSKNTFNQQKEDFNKELNSSNYTTEIDKLKIEYTDPNSNSTKVQIVPDYVTTYKPVTQEKTSLNLINYEFQTVVGYSDTLLTEASSQSDSIVSSASIVTSSIDEINKIIGDFSLTINDFSVSIAEPWMKYQDMIKNYGTLACNCFFAALAGLGGIVIVFTLFYVILKIKCVKIFIILIWNILALVMILSFIVGAIFGLIGIVGRDGTSVVYYIISPQNLNSESIKLIPSTISQKVNICLHGDGDLSSEFNTSSMNNLTELDKIKRELDAARENLTQHKNSMTITTINEHLDKVKVNFKEATKINQNLTTLLNSLNEKTNKGVKCDNTSLYDKWVVVKEDCDSKNPYSEVRGPIGKNNCLVFGNKEEDLKRYSCNPPINTSNYIQAIHEYKESNAKSIDELKKKNNDLNVKFTKVINQLIDTIDEVDNKLLKKVNDLSNSVMGSGEGNIISSLVNCRFLNGHIRMIYENLYDGLGTKFFTFGIVMEVISSAMALGICFLIPVLNRFNKTFPEDKKELNEEDNSPLKTPGNKEPAPTNILSDPEIIQVNKAGVKTHQKCLEKGRVIIRKVS